MKQWAHAKALVVLSLAANSAHAAQRQPLKNHESLRHFVTRPDIVAPTWNIQIHDQDALSPGYMFVAPYRKQDAQDKFAWIGPQIYDMKGDLVWSGGPTFDYLNAFDFRAVQVEGKQMASVIIHEREAAYILDNTYELYKTVPMVSEDDVTPWIRQALGKDKKTNFHDFSVLADGSRALMLTRLFENSTIEESRLVDYEGNCSVRWEGFKEVDLSRENRTLFDWDAHGHIALDEGTFARHNMTEECSQAFPDGWGLTHFNSIDKFPDGDYLISARHTNAVYKISGRDKSIIWRLGGVKSDFSLPGGAQMIFSRQHHARVHSQNTTHTMISLFDNAHSENDNDTPSNQQSRGLILGLRTDTNPMTATIVQKFVHPDALVVSKRGSTQILPNNNAFICWSESSAVTEHACDGRVLMEAHIELGRAASYRGFKFEWIGRPLIPPNVNATLSLCGEVPCTVVYVSWNGDTEVALWNVYRSNGSETSTQLASSARRTGFETRILFDGHADYVQVEALDKDGNALKRSELCQATPVDASPSPSAGGHDIFTFLLGVASTVVVVVVVWLVRQRIQRTAEYAVLSESDDGGDSDLNEEDFENLRLEDLPLASYADEDPQRSSKPTDSAPEWAVETP